MVDRDDKDKFQFMLEVCLLYHESWILSIYLFDRMRFGDRRSLLSQHFLLDLLNYNNQNRSLDFEVWRSSLAWGWERIPLTILSRSDFGSDKILWWNFAGTKSCFPHMTSLFHTRTRIIIDWWQHTLDAVMLISKMITWWQGQIHVRFRGWNCTPSTLIF